MSFDRVRSRLASGRPLVTDADTPACFRARGAAIDSPGAVGQLLRSRPDAVLEHYRAEVRSRVTILTALTADTTPRALAEVGMEHRAALLTGIAVELALDAAREAERPVAVAGVLGSELVAALQPNRMSDELAEHALRIVAAGVELILARGQGSRLELMAAVGAAAETGLPTWASVECLPGGALAHGGRLTELCDDLTEAGAGALLFEVSSIDDALSLLAQCREIGSALSPGVLLSAGPESVRGFPTPDVDPVRWAARALELDSGGARIIGGGAGTTEAYTRALMEELTALHPSIPASR
ncbi:MAG: homocysteine S-methyltransferase family protein [Myxococcales bacterium]|nr:homocysteine S-methyltransferase family protein [Myxococcales bacterium]